MAKELRVRGLRLHEEPVAGRHNKFVITEEGAWFLPFEDHANTPPLAEILVEVLRIISQTRRAWRRWTRGYKTGGSGWATSPERDGTSPSTRSRIFAM